MANGCQYCGTSGYIPESGAIVLNPKNAKKERIYGYLSTLKVVTLMYMNTKVKRN